MGIPLYQVDAFASRRFEGNPAAVCILDAFREDAWLQNLASEMNLAETAFVVRRPDGDFDLRWFTPGVEVDLCGHAPLASAHILWETNVLGSQELARFHTRGGLLTVRRDVDRIVMDFPSAPAESCGPPEGLDEAIGSRLVNRAKSRFDYLLELESESAVRNLNPDIRRLAELPVRGVIVTARGDDRYDIVSRFFAPAAGIDEDPVTGSAHCALAPYWAPKLGRNHLLAYQASPRGGEVDVELVGNRVLLGGTAVTVFTGELAP